MKKLISVFLVLALIISLCSCSLTSKNFNIGYLNEIDSLNPYEADGDGEKIIVANCFEGLLRFDENGEIDLGGATSYSVDSKMLSFTFTLNPDAVWHIPESISLDGFENKITAEAFVSGFEYLKEIGCTAFEGVEATAIDDFTLCFSLKKPDADFLYKLCSNPVIPYYPLDKNSDSLQNALTNGAYYIEKIDEGTVILKPCECYEGKLSVKNHKIVLEKFSTYAQLEKGFEKGKLDILLTDTFNRTDDDNFNEIVTKNNIWGVGFNFKNPYLQSKDLRLLILYTMNLEVIKTPAFAEGKATSIFFNSLLVSDKKLSNFEYTITPFEADLDFSTELDALLQKENAEHFSFKVLVPKQLESSFKKVIAQWESIFGEKIRFSLDTYKAENSVLATKQGNYDIAVLPLSPDGLTPAFTIEALSDSPFYYKNQKLTTYGSSAFGDLEKTVSVYEKAEKLVISEGAFVPLFYSGVCLYSQGDVSGFYPSPDGEAIYIHSGTRDGK